MLPALWRRRFQVRLLDASAMRKEADCKASTHTGLTPPRGFKILTLLGQHVADVLCCH